MHILLTITVALFAASASIADADAGFECAGYRPVARDADRAAAKMAGPKIRSLPASGTVRVLVIFARFKDEAGGNDLPAYAGDIFDPKREGSFTHFYDTMSFGQLKVEGTVIPKRYTSTLPSSAYLATAPGGKGKFSDLVLDVLEQADRDIDFGEFDNDGADGLPNSGDDSGAVDFVFVNMHSTPRDFIVGGATGIAALGFRGQFMTKDAGAGGRPIGVMGQVGRGAVLQEGTFAQTVGTMAHEFGHSLNLPDLYDLEYDGPEDDSAGIGRWGLMGWGAHGWNGNDGPNPLSAWCREELGWIGPDNSRLVELDGDARGLELMDLGSGGAVFKIPLGVAGDLWYTGIEYLLIEHRSRAASYYNRNMPSAGALVWHTRPSIFRVDHETFESTPMNVVNFDERRKGVDLVCADGAFLDAGYPLGANADGKFGGDNLDYWSHDGTYRKEHGGNQGDATDPFDGVRFRRLSLHTNPSSNPGGRFASASSGLELEMTRNGESMLLDVNWPRWAGAIEDTVQWVGSVIVDGDLTVEPDGVLQIHPGTRVRVAGGDRLSQGADRQRVELRIRGGLEIGRFVQYETKGTGGGVYYVEVLPEEIVFEGLNPGDRWYGIALEPQPGQEIWIVEDTYEIRDAERGIVVTNAPLDKPGLSWTHQLLDAPSLNRSGNSDGRLDPGEAFQLEVDFTNGSLVTYSDMKVQVNWDSDLLKPTWEPDTERPSRQVEADPFAIFPGGTHAVQLPSMMLKSRAETGGSVDLFVKIEAGSEVWLDTLKLEIMGNPVVHRVEWEVPDRSVFGRTLVLPGQEPAPVRVRIDEPVAGVDLVMVHGLEPLAEIPMEQSDMDGERWYETSVQLNQAGMHRLYLRIRRTDGAVVLHQDPLHVWSAPDLEANAALVFISRGYGDRERNVLQHLFAESLEEVGLQPQFIDGAPADAGFYEALLPHYRGQGNAVIWLGDTLELQAQQAMRTFLEEEGRLFLISPSLHLSPGIEAFLGEMLRARAGAGNAPAHRLRSPFLDNQSDFRMRYARIEPLSPAVPELYSGGRHFKRSFIRDGVTHQEFNDEGAVEPVGLRLAHEGYRLIYLPFDWPFSGNGRVAGRQQLESSLAFLRQRNSAPVVLEAPDKVLLGDGTEAVWFDRPVPILARVGTGVRAADLIVRGHSGLGSTMKIPMRRTGIEEGAQLFEAQVELPFRDHYSLSLNLQPVDGPAYSPNAIMQIAALLFTDDAPVLVYIDESYDNVAKATLRAQLEKILAEHELDAAYLDGQPGDAILLANHLRDKELVIALGDLPQAEVREALAGFLAGGGSLLLAARNLVNESTETTSLRELLHVLPAASKASKYTSRVISPDNSFEVKSFLFYVPVELSPPATPVLLDSNGEFVIGLRVDTEAYGAVYLSLKMEHVDASLQLIERHLELLLRGERVGTAVPAHLEINSLLAPKLQRPGQVTVELVVANKGGRPSEPVRVGYRLLRGPDNAEGQLVASGEVIVPGIPAYGNRDLILPPLDIRGGGTYDLEVELRSAGLGDTGSTASTAEPLSHRIRVLDDLPEPFVGSQLGSWGGGTGAALIDYDDDGDLDVYLLRLSRSNELFRNDPDRFVEVAEEAGLKVTGKNRSLAAADYDGDGDRDVYLVSEEENRFYRNDGGGRFAEVTAEMSADSLNRLADPGSGRSSGFFDADGDGDLDLYVVNAGGANSFFTNEEGRFREMGSEVGLADPADGRGLAFADFDRDGDTDLFIANNSGGSRLYRNDSGRFADATAVVGLGSTDGDVAGAFGDYDNDGDPDLFVANQRHQNRLYRSDLFGSFVEVTGESDLDLGKQSVGAAFIDYDSDGDLDLLTSGLSTGVPDQLYHNVDGEMVGVGQMMGLSQRTQGRGITFGDLDGDGDLDLFFAADTSRVYINSTADAHRLGVRLRAPGLNPHGIGAVVDVVAGELKQTRELQATFGYCSQGPLRLQFGLGAIDRVDTLRVRWPDGRVSVLTNLPAQEIELEHPVIAALRQPPLPADFRLLANFPNPFNASTQILYQLPGRSPAELSVYNAAGQLVRLLFSGVQDGGTHQIVWDGLDGQGRKVGSGVYVYRMRAGDWVKARKMVLVQ